MLRIYAIVLNQANSDPKTASFSNGFQTCLGLYNDYDMAHYEWKKLMSNPPSGEVNGLYWTSWCLDKPVLDGLDNEFRISKWCPSPDEYMDGRVEYSKQDVQGDQNIDSDINTIWIGVAEFDEIDSDTKEVICNHIEIITTGINKEFVEDAIKECNLPYMCQLKSYYIKQVELNCKPSL